MINVLLEHSQYNQGGKKCIYLSTVLQYNFEVLYWTTYKNLTFVL